ncbi:MAG: tetratricopeptide repeat protein, partial [Desulfuromonadales bacterium]|nr:tetratricopeptide repeat protein [Desulfuromonadales bacterium]
NKFLAAGDQEKAAAALEQVIQLEPLRYVRVYNQLAGLYEEMGEDERAVGIYQQSIAVKPDQLLPYLRMTLIHLQHRQYELAAAALDSARNKYPQAYEV